MLRTMLPMLLAATMAVMTPAQAQEAWPNRAITIYGGFPTGAGTDIYARKIAEPLSKALGVPVVVDARTGAGGNIASDLVAKARPDGYTFLLSTAGTHAINAALYKSLSFDVMKDFSHIALLGDVPNVLLLNPQKHPEVTSCQALIDLARANPGKLNFASTGNGSSGHLAGVQFAGAAGLDVVHVPYRGQGPAMTALLAQEVTFFFNQSGPSIPPVQQGQLRGLAVTLGSRLPPLPNVPTVAEACSLPGFQSSTWYGLMGPAGLPAPIQQRMSEEVVKIITEPAFRDWLVNSQGITPAADPTPAAFRKVHEADMIRWAEVVKKSGASVD